MRKLLSVHTGALGLSRRDKSEEEKVSKAVPLTSSLIHSLANGYLTLAILLHSFLSFSFLFLHLTTFACLASTPFSTTRTSTPAELFVSPHDKLMRNTTLLVSFSTVQNGGLFYLSHTDPHNLGVVALCDPST